MSMRHYLTITNKSTGEQVFSEQILGNNDYFDDKFYEALGIELDEDYAFDETEIDIVDFIYEWSNFLHRHPKMRGLPKLRTEEEYQSRDAFKEYLFYSYSTAESYELQIYRVSQTIANILMDSDIGALNHPDKDFLFTLECF